MITLECPKCKSFDLVVYLSSCKEYYCRRCGVHFDSHGLVGKAYSKNVDFITPRQVELTKKAFNPPRHTKKNIGKKVQVRIY